MITELVAAAAGVVVWEAGRRSVVYIRRPRLNPKVLADLQAPRDEHGQRLDANLVVLPPGEEVSDAVPSTE